MTTPVVPVAAAGQPAAGASPDQAKLKKAAQAFEAVFVRQMIGSMRTSSLGDGLLDSSASQQFRDMSDAKLADTMARKSALHIADMLMKKFGAQATTAPAPAHPEERLSLSKPRLEGPAATSSALRDGISTSSMPPQDERSSGIATP